MKDFIELTRFDGVKIIVNINAVKAILPRNEAAEIFFFCGEEEHDGLIVQEKYDDLLHLLVPSSRPPKKDSSKAGKGVIIR